MSSFVKNFDLKVREVSFQQNAEFIGAFRRAAYGDELCEDTDYFDEQAHHFFLFDKDNQVIAMWRILRSDECEYFEITEDAQLWIICETLTIEISRFCSALNARKKGEPVYALFNTMLSYCTDHHIDTVIAWAREGLLPLYKKFGFEICGEAFKPRRFKSIHYPIVLHRKNLVVPSVFQK